MTKSTITRERIQRIMRAINSEAYDEEEIREWLSSDEIMELSRMALAAMDGEPVAYMTYKGYLLHAGDPKLAEYSEPMPLYADPRPEPISAEPVAWLLSGGGAKNVVVFDGGNAYADPLREVTPLYRHAQPAPVSYSDFEEFWSAYIHPLAQDDELKGFAWDIWSVLGSNSQPAPVVPEEVTAEDCPALVKYDVTEVDEAWARGFNACRSAMLATAPQLPGSEPATVPGKWIPVSEQMPPSRHEVLVGRWWGEKPRWCCKWATYIPGHPDSQSSGWLIPGASWTPTHWMPLPAAPQEVKGE
ncbi:TPA: DUF551 domain-containing protein [Klebsiella pneumoniae]|nr:DUF551 domain-containing protein [Klebsiella pneumoniae]